MGVFRRPIVAACLAAVVLSSCSSSKSDSDSADPAATGASTPTTVASAAAPVGGPTSARELEALLVTTVPDGFERQPDDVGDTGPSNLAKAIRDDGRDDAGVALRDEGFVRGYQRLWIGPDDAEIIVFLYQFETDAGATANFERAREFWTDESLPSPTTFAIDGLPADSATVAASDSNAAIAIVQFHTGVYNVQIVSNGPTPDGLQDRVSSVAKDQFSRL